MELVYLWVEDYKNIKNQGFNFSPKFNCHYDENTNELTIDENDDYIENFFGDNINVTAIVGKNGSGKSSLLELIIDFSDKFNKDYKVFYIIEKDDNLVIYRNDMVGEIKSKDKITQYEFQRTSENRYKLTYAYLSLSPFLNNMDYLYEGIGDKKYLASIYNYRDDYKNKTFNYTDFYLRMIYKIPNLLKQKYIQKLFSVKGSPHYLVIKFNSYIQESLNDSFMEVDKYAKQIKKSDEKYTYVLPLSDSIKVESLANGIELSKKDIEKKIRKIETEKAEIENKLEKDTSKGLLPEPSKPTKTAFDKEYDALYKDPYQYGNSSDEESIQSKLNRATNFRINASRKKITKYTKEIEELEENIKKLGTIEFNLTEKENGEVTFYFSSGELVLLFYVEKLMYISQKEEDIILLIDENELFLHPDWQKKFLLFLTEIFADSEHKRQIIISTHSPFLISDMPKENIIFLKEGKINKGIGKNQTFGANIHTLLSDSFFMKDGLMGEFARGKINEIIDFHKEVEEENKNKNNLEPLQVKYKEDKTKFWNTQSIIGDEYLKQVIKNHLVDIETILLGHDAARQAEIERLRAEADRLDSLS